MKRFSIVLLLSIAYSTNAQDTIYFDKNWVKTTKENSEFYRPLPLKKVGELVLLKDYYKNGQLQFQAYIYPEDERKYVGDVYWYDENGYDNGFRQNINLSKEKVLVYYNTDNSIWKKISYTNFGEKAEIIIYLNGKELINGKIIDDEFSGSFSPKKPSFDYENPFQSNKDFKRLPYLSPVPLKSDPVKTYSEIIFWQNGKKASETITRNYSTQPTLHWDKSGNLITHNSDNFEMTFYTKNGFATDIKSKKELSKDNQNYYLTETLYSKNGQEISRKYKNNHPYDGRFDEKDGRFNSIYQMKNGNIIGEVIVKDSKTSKIIAKGDYKDGIPNNGTFISEIDRQFYLSNYKNQKKDGLQKIFNNSWSEDLAEEFEMKNDLNDGFRKIYYKDNSVLISEYKNGKPFSGTILENDIKTIYKNGNIIQKEELNSGLNQNKFVETFENNKLKTKTYFNFSIKEKLQSSYTGTYKDEKPYDGYFINKIILNEIPLVDFYEKGQIKYQYSVDFLKEMDQYPFYEYDQKSVYTNGKIIDGFDFLESDEGILCRIKYKNGKANYLELNLFAMHAFNRLTFDYKDNQIVIKDFEKQNSIKFTEKNTGIFAEVFDENGKLIVNNLQKEVPKGSPNSITIYKEENNQLKEENISSASVNPLYEKVYVEINPIIAIIYTSIAYNRTIKLDELFNQFTEIFKSNNIQKLYGQESFIGGPNKTLSSLRFNSKGKPEWGVKITQINNEFLTEFYEDGKITLSKKVDSFDQIQETINAQYIKSEKE